uniref:Uncharacterized protein n=1 Tax=Anguilla anguilla TaxID=7936 RepID=A0A0E9RCU7_ANGAN
MDRKQQQKPKQLCPTGSTHFKRRTNKFLK